jgi:hypothetical protein
MEFPTTEAYSNLRVRLTTTSEGYTERQKKGLLSKLAPTAYLSQKICNPHDGENAVWSQISTLRSSMQSVHVIEDSHNL